MRRAGIYARISKDRQGTRLGVDRQIEDCEQLAATRGWTVAQTYVDNDVSATSLKPRPQYQQMLRDIEAGAVQALVVWSLDRLYRRPLDLEGLIPLVERHGVALATVGGDVDLSTRGGLLHARIMGAVAADEVRAKSDRVKRQQRQAAEQGRWLGGTRPFGFEADGLTLRHDEAEVTRNAARDVLAGVSLAEVFRGMNAAGVTTTRGLPWGYTQLRQMLLRPRNAGIITHEGVEVARLPGDPILSEDVWAAVCEVLRDPRRRTSQSNTGRWLLAGLARCGADGCGQTVKSATVAASRNTGRTRPVYRCRTGGHFARAADLCDEQVHALMVQWLADPERLRELVPAAGREDSSEDLRSEAAALRRRRAALADNLDVDEVTMARRDRALRERLEALESQLTARAHGATVADLLAAPDVAAAWAATPLARQRAVIHQLMTVTILPSGRLGRTADYTRFLHVQWLPGR